MAAGSLISSADLKDPGTFECFFPGASYSGSYNRAQMTLQTADRGPGTLRGVGSARLYLCPSNNVHRQYLCRSHMSLDGTIFRRLHLTRLQWNNSFHCA